MPAPLSNDLRLRVITYHQKHGSNRKELAEIFNIGEATVYRWIKKFRETGAVDALPMGVGGFPLITDDKLDCLKALVKKKPDRTLTELCKAWREKHDVELSLSSMARALSRAGLTLKKNR